MCFFFFFKQKTAYEMRISDWSSDVCSSDLEHARVAGLLQAKLGHIGAADVDRRSDDTDQRHDRRGGQHEGIAPLIAKQLSCPLPDAADDGPSHGRTPSSNPQRGPRMRDGYRPTRAKLLTKWIIGIIGRQGIAQFPLQTGTGPRRRPPEAGGDRTRSV